MKTEEFKKEFPPGFPVDSLPSGAKEQRIEVFRICRTGKVESDSFLPSYLDELSQTKEHFNEAFDIGHYSLSTFWKLKEAEKKLRFFRGHQPCAILAKGVTEPVCGVCQKTRERTGKKSSHVDWWLYVDACPHIYFKEVQTEEVKQDDNS